MNEDTVTIELTRKEALVLKGILAQRTGSEVRNMLKEYRMDGRCMYDFVTEKEFHDIGFSIRRQCGFSSKMKKTLGELEELSNPNTPTKLGCRPIKYSTSGIDLGDDYQLTPKQLRAMADKCEEG